MMNTEDTLIKAISIPKKDFYPQNSKQYLSIEYILKFSACSFYSISIVEWKKRHNIHIFEHTWNNEHIKLCNFIWL